MIVTVAERKSEEAARRSAAVAAVVAELRDHARRLGGRYILHGSAARGAMRYDSDVDLVLDFPSAAEGEAWRFAEKACHRHRLPCDILPLAMTEGRFRARLEAEGVVLS
ncbi:nucleotidyltransferase family protein [Jiella avicenniae]|uniref:Nucleotidyltransferase domain-containing protein n=1 Tax=Jiella avicenniae TaxID=2907202 RepID=A0A9X1P1V2_9HYPH|nr:nucleotidyltransferase domain-containing protein [Jiella avicenniae]MCE7027813.1 nucleotidyltransferase domain-containing protein [Jiella avicenniae]